MIEINLLPGATKKSRGRGPGLSLKAATAGFAAKIKDPYLIAGVAGVVLAAGAIGGMHFYQTSTMGNLEVREAQARRDSTRFALVLKERRTAEAKRDSVLKQLAIIRSIDDDRFIWPHLLDEVSRSLPPYTWLKSIAQTSTTQIPTVATPAPPAAEKKEVKKDPEPSNEPVKFRIIGHTVDIQALTRFMKLLETSPFVANVQLARSEMVLIDGKEVTEFQLDAEYERPDRALLTTAPVSLSVR
jgi:Tfp pilus assembly protein PilN